MKGWVIMAAEQQLVVFELGGQQYGLPVLQTQEIMRMVKVNPVPSAGECIEGVINLRGQVIPVVNLSRRLSLPKKIQDGDARIIVVEREGRKPAWWWTGCWRWAATANPMWSLPEQ